MKNNPRNNLRQMIRFLSAPFFLILLTISAAGCPESGSKTPQEVLTAAFEALEASNVELWNKTQIEDSTFRDTVGMINFKKLVGLDSVPEGNKLGLSPGRSVQVNKLGNLAIIYQVQILLQKSSNTPAAVVAEAKVGCSNKPDCQIIDFFEPGK